MFGQSAMAGGLFRKETDRLKYLPFTDGKRDRPLMIDRKKLCGYVIAAAGLSVLFTLRLGFSFRGVTDAVTLSGISFLILALFRTARYLRFYDLPVFGFKKFVELWKKDYKKGGSSVGEYHEFVKEVVHVADFKEAYAVSATCLLASAALSLLI